MIDPKALVAQLNRYWPFLVALMELSKDQSSFDAAHLLRIAGRELPKEDRRAALARMVQSGLLQEMDGGYELHFPTLTFMEALHKEQPLGHVGVIEGHIRALQDANDELAAGLDDNDFAGRIPRAEKMLSRQAREIHGQVEADFDAILDLVERAKAADADMPRSDRYDLVLKAHDDYLKPMMELISVDGAFSGYLSVAVERLVDAAGRARRANVSGGLERELETTAARLRSLLVQIRERMGRAAQLLRPLVDQAQRHNELARHAATILGAVRKRGAAVALPADVLPRFIRTRQYTLRLGLSVEAVIAKARAAEVVPRRFPDLSPRSRLPMVTQIVQVDQIIKALDSEPEPVTDVLAWIHTTYPDLGLRVTMGRYFALIRHTDEWSDGRRMRPSGPIRSRSLPFGGRRLIYTPHALTKENA